MALVPRLQEMAVSLALIPWALQLVWQSARRWTVGWLALVTIQGLLPVGTVYLTRDLVNQLVAVDKQGLSQEQLYQIAPIILALVCLLLLG